MLPHWTRVDLGAMAMKVCPAFLKTPVSLGLTIRFFSVISSILILGVVPLCRGTVGVFYSPRRPGWYYHWITYESWYSIKQRNRTFFFRNSYLLFSFLFFLLSIYSREGESLTFFYSVFCFFLLCFPSFLYFLFVLYSFLSSIRNHIHSFMKSYFCV